MSIVYLMVETSGDVLGVAKTLDVAKQSFIMSYSKLHRLSFEVPTNDPRPTALLPVDVWNDKNDRVGTIKPVTLYERADHL